MLEVSLVKTKNPIYLPIKNSNSIGYVLRSRKNYKLKYMKKIIISTGIKIKEPQNLYVFLWSLFDDRFETPSSPLIYISRKDHVSEKHSRKDHVSEKHSRKDHVSEKHSRKDHVSEKHNVEGEVNKNLKNFNVFSGIINDFSDEIKVTLINIEINTIYIKEGEIIAQLIIQNKN